jgi:hypothetical protein
MLYDIESMRRFCGIEPGDQAVPDETTILNFRRLLERHRLTEAIFKAVRKLLEEKRLLLKDCTLIDATIINAPPSTKNEDREHDPEMSQTRKGNHWYFDMKVHIGTNAKGIVHTATTTKVRDADVTQLPNPLHGKETVHHGLFAAWMPMPGSKNGACARGFRSAWPRAARAPKPRRPATNSGPWPAPSLSTPSTTSSSCAASSRSVTTARQKHNLGVCAPGARQSLSRATPIPAARW